MGNNGMKPTTMSQTGTATFYKLEEDIACSVCLNELEEPVSITCGHTYCRKCISAYWATPQDMGYRCPECRQVCPRDQLIPEHRLRNMIPKIQLAVKDEQANKENAGHPIQLVYTDGSGRLQLDESAVQSCFLGSEVSGYPVCLICVIGEKRRGKSFLMNYILRALHREEKGQPVTLGADDEPLQGFEWKSGTDSTTKGIWIWSRPFILEHSGEKMAVYVLDTEGTLDIEGDRDTCIKLSALSMMLSSYLILNVSSNLKVTELDYLEMYLHISELIGKSYSLQYLQHLDILVRDWHDFDNCGREAARAYLNNETETMRKTGKYSRVLETFRSPSASCFLMPHPGKRIPQTSQGRLIDMDEDFRSELRTYVSDLVRGVWRYMKTDIHEEKLACAQLGQILKEFVKLLRVQQYSFSSPLEMFFSVENHKCMKNIKKEFQDFMETQAPSTASLFKILAVRPSQMRSRVSGEASRLRQHFEVSLQGTDGRQQLLEELESHLLDAGNKFCADYSKRFTKCAVGIGFAVGGGVLSLAGGVVGAAVAGTVLATEAVALLGSTTAALVTGAVGGSVSMAVVGGGVGAGVGGAIGRREKRREQEAEEASNNQGSAEAEAPLLKHQ